MIEKSLLVNIYKESGKSMQEVADYLGCSLNKVCYWMDKHGIKRRSISDAVYLKNNPDGDPFEFKEPRNQKEAYLCGLGLGLYWGEGTKANKYSVRLGNTDPELIKVFINFLEVIFSVPKSKLKFGLQLFTDVNQKEALQFWLNELGVDDGQFYKVTSTVSGSIGTYRKKNKYGVVTIYYNNKKLRNLLVDLIPNSTPT